MRRAVRNIIRLIAAGLIVFGALEIGLELMRHRLKKAEINPWDCVIGALLAVAGAVLFGMSTSLARRWTEDFDD